MIKLICEFKTMLSLVKLRVVEEVSVRGSSELRKSHKILELIFSVGEDKHVH